MKHYVPAVFAYDASWVARARRAGALDKVHGYPKQSSAGIGDREVAAYEKAYEEAERA